ncbi:MAG: hypothetical protein SGJ03_16645 [Alphaproteobacteria bacterium]|nr:hypothetical protein [Alphaproteobacteria bacterium]
MGEARFSDPVALLKNLEAERGSVVIPVLSSLDMNTLEIVLAKIRTAPVGKRIDVILHSEGGNALAGQQIARALKAHEGTTTVFVPYFALESATFIALAADEIAMGPNAALTPIDPVVSISLPLIFVATNPKLPPSLVTEHWLYPASSILKGIRDKPASLVEDRTYIAADMARKLTSEARRVVCELTHDGRNHGESCIESYPYSRTTRRTPSSWTPMART